MGERVWFGVVATFIGLVLATATPPPPLLPPALGSACDPAPVAYSVGLFYDPTVDGDVLKAVEMALADVNSSQILGADTLSLTTTGPDICDAASMMPHVAKMLSTHPTAVVGIACSSVVAAVSPLLAAATTPLLSFQTTSPSIRNITAFPWSLLFAPSDVNQASAIVSIILNYGWQRVGVLGSNDLYGARGSAAVVDLLRAQPLSKYISVVAPDPFPPGTNVSSLVPVMDLLNAENVRVIVLFLEPDDIRTALEAAYAAGLYGPQYVFIFTDTAGRYNPFYLFTSDAMMRAAAGGLVIQIAAIQDTFTEKRWRILYSMRYPATPIPAPNAPFAYDTIWTIAKGIAAAKANGACSIDVRGALLTQSMLGVNFEGASGGINFTQNFVSTREYAILNVRGLAYEVVGGVNRRNQLILQATNPIVWSDGTTDPPSIRRYPIAVMSYSAVPDFALFIGAVQFAISQLNSVDDGILAGDTIEFDETTYLADEHCDESDGADAMTRLAALTPPPIAVIGPYCSIAGVGVMRVANQKQIPVISPASPSTVFNDRALYPYFARTSTSLRADVAATVQVLMYFGWQRIAVLGTDDAFSGAATKLLIKQCAAAGIDIIPTERWTRGDPASTVVAPILSRLKAAAPDLRVLVAFVHADTMAVIARAALQVGLYGAGYALFAAANLPFDEVFNDQSLAPVLNGMLVLERTPLNTTTLANFYRSYTAAGFKPDPTIASGYARDAVYVLAEAVRNTKNADFLPTSGPQLMNAIYATNLVGVTGIISYPFPIPNQNARFGEDYTYTLSNAFSASSTLHPALPNTNSTLVPIGIVPFDGSLALTATPVFSGSTTALPQSCAGGTRIDAAAVNPTSQRCIPCEAGKYAGENAASCVACPDGSYCPFASPAPLDTALSTPSPATITQPPASGSLTTDSKLRELFAVYAFIGLGFVIGLALLLTFAVFVCCPNDRHRPIFELMDRAFTLQHPTRMGKSPIKRRTVWGGAFTLYLFVLSILITAYLVNRFFVDKYSMSQTLVPGLEDLNGQSIDITFRVTLLGMDRPGGCAAACNSMSSTGVVGTFTCTTATATSCAVSFRASPTPGTGLIPVLPPNFALNFAFPNTRAQAIQWELASGFGSALAYSYGAAGTIVPPSGGSAVYYGYASLPTVISMLIRPAIFEHFNLLFADLEHNPPLPCYLSYVAGPTVMGSTVNATNFYHPFVNATAALTPDPTDDDGAPGVYIVMTGQRETAVTFFSVGEIDPNAVLLVSSVSALVGGLFSIIRFSLKMLEKIIYECDKRRAARENALRDAAILSGTGTGTLTELSAPLNEKRRETSVHSDIFDFS